MGSITEPIDLKSYGRLLAKAAPCVITTKAEHERAVAAVDALLEKGERNMTPEEDALLDLLTSLIRTYETLAYPVREKSSPGEMVAFLLDQRALKPSALWPVLGSKSRVSEILAGKRSISKEQAKKLADFFHVAVALFI
jgi:HTH-type transcriptional regulator/antitoxin HigA